MTTTTTSLRDTVTAFVGVPARTQTYRNLLYLALAFPLGVAYFVFLVTGFSLGVSLAITLLGVPVLLATLGAAHLLTNVEAELANRLLGTDVSTASLDTSGGVVSTAKRLVTAPRTWLGVVYLFVKFAFGIVAFAALSTLLSVSVSLLAAPLTYSSTFRVGVHTGPASFGPLGSTNFAVDTFPEAVGAAAVGLVVGIVSLHVLNALARVSGMATEAILSPTETN